MNWYKKAQLYEDVLDDNYYSGDPETREAELYFSIGQNEETIEESYCWIWNGERLLIKQGPTTHNMAFRYLGNPENFYRGWVDNVQKMISIAIPRQIPGTKSTVEDVPNEIIKALYYKFDTDYQIKVF